MKQYLLLVFLFTGLVSVKSQSFEIQGGVSLSSVSPNTLNLNFDENYGMNVGFNAGFAVSFPISKRFSIKTGLLWDTKGFHKTGYELLKFPDETVFTLYDADVNAKIFYLDIPLLLRESYIINDKSYIFAEAGGYLGIGMLGKFFYDYTKVATGEFRDSENDINWGNSSEGEIRRLDYGLSFGLGYQLYAVQIALAYDLGLANVLADINTDRTIKNRTFRASIVYVINGNSKKKFIKRQLETAPSK
jgi:hypothetical protein